MIISLILIVFFFVSLVSAIRINEVELNPDGSDSGNEWVELYSEDEIDLTDWKLVNNDDDEFELIDIQDSFSGYLIVEFDGRWLDNSNERVFLYNNESLIDESDEFDDGDNDDYTWQYCDNWKFLSETKDSDNECGNDNNEDENNEDSNSEIYLEIEWDEEDIENKNDFKIKVHVFNLEDEDYDLKIWIENDDDEIISDRYDEGNEEWKSGQYYVNEFFTSSGNESEKIKLRMREDFEDFEGDAIIFARLRRGYEIEEDIEILETEEVVEETIEEDNEAVVEEVVEETTINTPITGQVIKLGSSKTKEANIDNSESEDIKTQGNIIYQSEDIKINQYAILGFAFLCVGLSVLVIFRKLN